MASPARLATTNVTNWKQEQKEDPVLYQVAKHLRAPHETFRVALHKVLDKKATAAYVKAKEHLIKNGLLYWKTQQGQADETVFQFVVPQRHRGAVLDGCYREAAHQGQCRSIALMQERFWWPGMTRDLRNRIKKCSRCRKYEAAPPVAPMKPLTCSGPGELLYVDLTSIEETVPLREDPSSAMCWFCRTTSSNTLWRMWLKTRLHVPPRDSEDWVFRAFRCTCLPCQ